MDQHVVKNGSQDSRLKDPLKFCFSWTSRKTKQPFSAYFETKVIVTKETPHMHVLQRLKDNATATLTAEQAQSQCFPHWESPSAMGI